MITYAICVIGFGTRHALARDMTRNEAAAKYRSLRLEGMRTLGITAEEFDSRAKYLAIELADGEEVEPRHYARAALETARP